jgi:hypothetical protein
MAVEVEVCHLCNVELADDSRVIVVAKESPQAMRVLAHVHCAFRAAAKVRANE